MTVRVSAPFLVEKLAVNFTSHPGAAACRIEFDGLPDQPEEVVYGIDSVQALSLATDLDGFLKHWETRYEFFWETGEPYFED